MKWPVRHVNLSIDYYNRSFMVNQGAKVATSPVLAILDSDRVLPAGYFSRQPERRECVSTLYVDRALRDCDDQEIEDGTYPHVVVERSVTNEMHSMNIGSGNTMLWAEDFWKVNGMDESFVGYGYNDTDFATKLAKHGLKLTFLPVHEIHLYHERQLPSHEYQMSNLMNAIRYCNKWHVQPNQKIYSLAEKLNVDLSQHINTCKMFI